MEHSYNYEGQYCVPCGIGYCTRANICHILMAHRVFDVFIVFIELPHSFHSTSRLVFILVPTPATKAYLKQYIQTEDGLDVVARGGYYQLEKEVAASVGMQKLKALGDLKINSVAAGGWYNVQQLAADPKGALVAMIVESIQNQSNTVDAQNLEAILSLLEAQGKGFSAELVEGTWCSVLSKSTKKSPTLQKAIERTEQGKNDIASFSQANFDTRQGKFFGSTKFGKRTELKTTVQYNPVSAGFSTKTVGGKTTIVLRRIMCDIVAASLKVWRFPLRIPLGVFVRRKGGYLDFLYMDDDIRITKGNRGGIFVHFRPEFLEKVLL